VADHGALFVFGMWLFWVVFCVSFLERVISPIVRGPL
jgi:hypothetical protein